MTTIEVAERADEVGEEPCSPYELLTRARVEELAEDVEGLKKNIDILLWNVLGAITIDVVLRQFG